MKLKFTNFARCLLLIVGVMATLPSGLFVLCLGHHSGSQLELLLQDACAPVEVAKHAHCETDVHERCVEKKHCTDIPVHLQMLPSNNIFRQYQAMLLAKLPSHLNRMASSALTHKFRLRSLSLLDEIACSSDPAMTTGSIVLVI